MEQLTYLVTTLEPLRPTPATLATLSMEAAPGHVKLLEAGVGLLQLVNVSPLIQDQWGYSECTIFRCSDLSRPYHPSQWSTCIQ